MARSQLEVVPLPALEDNYIYAVVDREDRQAAIVDPGDAEPVLRFLDRERLGLAVILVTHHHDDHIAGIAPLARRTPGLRIVGPLSERERVPGLTELVREGDRVDVLGRDARVLEIPGHTRGHVGYALLDDLGGGELFSGDTVFGGTIGNLFEGTPDDMFRSLEKIRALPAGTRIWCGHEYTLTYVRDAAAFDPSNAELAARLARVEAQVARQEPAVGFTLAEERATSPFFRWDDPGLAARLETAPGLPTFRRLCEVL
jgi:hydroxyacylglutathione hydrolase